jgi:hypothetical protein
MLARTLSLSHIRFQDTDVEYNRNESRPVKRIPTYTFIYCLKSANPKICQNSFENSKQSLRLILSGNQTRLRLSSSYSTIMIIIRKVTKFQIWLTKLWKILVLRVWTNSQGNLRVGNSDGLEITVTSVHFMNTTIGNHRKFILIMNMMKT